MNILDTLALFMIMITLAAIPSTSVALVVTRSATSGLWHGAAVSVGIVLGDLIFALLAILGLTVLSELMGALFLLIRYAAGVYLIWFGINLIRSRNQTIQLKRSSSTGGLIASFLTGLLVTLGDVKAIFFYASLFPTFLELSNLGYGEIAWVLGVIIVTVGGVKLTYAVLAKKVATIARRFSIAKQAKVASGSLMIGSGTYLIIRS
ncbi:threonine efflux protein [Leptolyngbya sp. Heron Island J]|uniref:LysE family translocator n=1 Tax=Leptolyngbya sp. Heron Island J TaxID=1385935 RepID=UPI0003B9DE04|nr:LysE family translocator [Leptolyngbya sp. Heron Island J]ESA33577.1 threonine efflux protein [Leptolyngbya sp. Heron Island J]